MNEPQNIQQRPEKSITPAVVGIELNEEQMDQFLALLEEEPKELTKLQTLFARRSVFE